MNLNITKEHLLKRNPDNGTWWPVLQPLRPKVWSKELWHFDGNNWQNAISPDMKITEYGTNLPFLKPKLTNRGKIYRVITRDQLIYKNESIIHLPPIPTNKNRMERNFHFYVEALSQYCVEGSDLLTEKGREDFNSKWVDLTVDKKGGKFKYRNETFTAYETALAKVLYINFETLCDGLSEIIKKIRKEYMGLAYIYNAHLGNRWKHYLDFLVSENTKMPPEVLNLATNVRFFTTKNSLLNTINYIVAPSVFRGYDIYKRGINGRTHAQRLSNYVVIEYNYSDDEYNSGRIEISDFEKHYNLLKTIFSYDEETQKKEKISFPNGKGKEEKQSFLLNALKVWSNVFSEIRLFSNGIKPHSIYKLDAIWSESCKGHDKNDPCPICTQFFIGEKIDCNVPGMLGALGAYGIMPDGKISDHDFSKYVSVN